MGTPGVAQEVGDAKPSSAIGVTVGIGSADVEGGMAHLSVSYEDYWSDSNVGLIAEVGIMAGAALATVVSPGLTYSLRTGRGSAPYLRAGFSLVTEYPGFHLGGGYSLDNGGSGLRFEGRYTNTPGANDWFVEFLVSYRFKL